MDCLGTASFPLDRTFIYVVENITFTRIVQCISALTFLHSIATERDIDMPLVPSILYSKGHTKALYISRLLQLLSLVPLNKPWLISFMVASPQKSGRRSHYVIEKYNDGSHLSVVNGKPGIIELWVLRHYTTFSLLVSGTVTKLSLLAHPLQS